MEELKCFEIIKEKDFNKLPHKNKNPYIGYVYALQYGQKIKVGHTTNLKNRISSLKRQAKYNKVKTTKVMITPKHTNYIENEKILHEIFKDYRFDQTELFDITMDLFKNEAIKLSFLRNEKELEKHADESPNLIIEMFKKSLGLVPNNINYKSIENSKGVFIKDIDMYGKETKIKVGMWEKYVSYCKRCGEEIDFDYEFFQNLATDESLDIENIEMICEECTYENKERILKNES